MANDDWLVTVEWRRLQSLLVVTLLALATGTSVATQISAPQSTAACRPDPLFDRIYAAYKAGNHQAIAENAPKEPAFDKVRLALCFAQRGSWQTDRQPIQLAFIADLAKYGLDQVFRYWLDVVDEGRKFAVSRSQPPGVSFRDDELELLFHRTMGALLAGLRRPDYLLKYLVTPLETRVSALPVDPPAPRLIDPWIELVAGFAREQFSILNPEVLPTQGLAALRHYDEAARHESTRAEALVRKSWLLTRLGRPADALTMLDAFADRTTERGLIVISRLSRGKALEALDRPDDALRAYMEALSITPGAQSPLVALAALELGRSRFDEASKWADQVRKATTVPFDPWWQYVFGDRRFLDGRLARLREAGR